MLGTFSGNSFPIYLLSLFDASGCLGIYRIDEAKSIKGKKVIVSLRLSATFEAIFAA